jgi:hypothetical protein
MVWEATEPAYADSGGSDDGRHSSNYLPDVQSEWKHRGADIQQKLQAARYRKSRPHRDLVKCLFIGDFRYQGAFVDFGSESYLRSYARNDGTSISRLKEREYVLQLRHSDGRRKRQHGSTLYPAQ